MKVFHLVRQYWIFALAGFMLILLLFIPIRLAIASYQAPQPQAIVTLGGSPYREKFTAQFAQIHPSLDIWISSGNPPEEIQAIFKTAGTPSDRLHLDYRATDTVTNFTTLVSDFKQRQIQHLYLITSDFHMPRAKAIATIVLGSHGITFTPVPISSSYPRESMIRIFRDFGRSVVWIFTGRTGASLRASLSRPLFS
ncbi:YdcF family protein [Nostoc sp. CENA67]|uniref:YdcF family protein n=1 Tax=Amazonocrinis nigriterrae CENA67 TaxID=2794033 RepID=A0A8J7HRM4_9NOST|nr:YdcF family protein [Amazonocrinis nigriterrae]MBH8561029.1 YdcF family protein [Amazonocrinis nigriterrae CENA67]